MKFKDLVLLVEDYSRETHRFINFMLEVTGMTENETDDFIKWFVNTYSHECFRDEGLIDPKLLRKLNFENDIDGLEHWMDYLRSVPVYSSDASKNMFDYLYNYYQSIIYNIIDQHNNGVTLASDKKKVPPTIETEEHVARHVYDEYKRYKSLISGLKAFKYRKPI